MRRWRAGTLKSCGRYSKTMIKGDFQASLNRTLWRLKGIAIISVVCAHCNIQIEGAYIPYLRNVLTNAGSIGVGIFFLLSGYFFHNASVPLNEFVRKTARRLVVPWLLAGTCVWLYVALRKGGLGIAEWGLYVLGVNSAFYFMTDLLILQAIFYVLEKLGVARRCSTMVILLLVNELFIILESRGCSLFPTSYLDFFCFIGYFALGRYLANENHTATGRNLLVRCCVTLRDNRWLSSGTVLCSAVLILSPLEFTYFKNALSLVFECFFILAAFILALHVNADSLEWLGRKSFFIYLWHLPAAGILSNLGSRSIVAAYAGLLWPAVVLAVMWMVIVIFERLRLPDGFYEAVGLRK